MDRAWVQSLYDRGVPTTYAKTRNELRYIGMPVGGICCGCVYVGGDGRLWLWDIFNQNQLGVVTKILPIKLESFNLKEINNVEGTLYLEPLTQASPFQQGFALSITYDGKTVIKRLQQDDWDEVTFEATYPVATIRYTAQDLPLEVTLEAFSPFIPGNAQDSGLPATIQAISLTNTSAGSPLSVEIMGWIENKVLLNTEKTTAGFTRVNKVTETNAHKGVLLSCTGANSDLEKAPDYGSLYFAAIGKKAVCIGNMHASQAKSAIDIRRLVTENSNSPMAAIATRHRLPPGGSAKSDFIIAWHMRNVDFTGKGNMQGMTVEDANFHYYSTLFDNAEAVATYISSKYRSLKDQTMLWRRTWYDSTLPWWFLERTLSNISAIASTSTHRFQSGRYYAWEGVGCCHGNCTHVYQYAHAVSRIFPELERDTRERVDLGIGYDEATGMIRIRGEKTGPSIDGQAGTVLRIYREHQMSPDYSFMKKNWPKIKKAVQFIMEQDRNHDGMEDTPMENTLDALWHGEISWIVGLCIAGVRAGRPWRKK